VLFGSVSWACTSQSDWDFGYLASTTLDEELLRERFTGILGRTLSIWLTCPRPAPC